MFRETLEPLILISIGAAAVQLHDAALPAALATAGIRELLQREGVGSLESGNPAKASRMMPCSAMLGAQRAARMSRLRARPLRS